eukprot:TRINITY_DN19659_c0_g1_i2.p1 TRINITY_DN19659_c0_g1~~TRINITY_DN19659_c0_g1_i2.p1  ORF type:complete len:539 (+),score=123.73 TRINITY_DN19659_c0_g1_i2:192-1808(+)
MCIRDREKNPNRPSRSGLCPKDQWVKDNTVNACDSCGTAFSMFTRRHHCRRCGHIFCKDCCSKIELTGRKVLTCNPCQESTGHRKTTVEESHHGASSEKPGGWFGRSSKKSQDHLETREVDMANLRAYPRRMVTKSPGMNKSLTNGFGRLRIEACEATGLLAADMAFLGKDSSDPFMTMHVGEHQKSVAKTKTVNNTLHPKWHSTHVFPVFSPFADVKVQVYDSDLASHDDILGVVSFPLSVLVSQPEHDVWLYLSVAPGQADEPNNEPCHIPPGAQIGLGSYGAEDRRLGAVRLKLTLEMDESSEYLAHFVREVAPPAPQPEMDIDLMYGNIFALQDQVWPVIGLVWIVLDLLKWTDLVRSRIALATWMACCYWPGLTPLVVHVLLLRHLYQKHQLIKVFRESDELGSPVGSPPEDDKHAATLGWVGGVANSSKLMMPAATKEWLGGIQNTLGSTAETLDGVYGMFDWRDYGTTKTITMGVFGSLVLHATVIPWGYTMMSVSYTHLRAHETPEHLVCRLLLEKKKNRKKERDKKSRR